MKTVRIRIAFILAAIIQSGVWVLAGMIGQPCFSEEITGGNQNPFHDLAERLSADGFDPALIASLYGQRQVKFDVDSVSLFFIHRESKINYDQFTSPGNISIAGQYMGTHADRLFSAEQGYEVEKEVVTAIILVETRLGAFTGKSSILDTLSTMAALSEQSMRDYLWDRIPSDRRFSRLDYDNKAMSKSQWAYAELKAFLKYTKDEGISPAEIKGSYAGAMGISQFMPSNIQKLARDGNNDGRVDLFDHADAIMSVANYLHYHGWKKGMPRAEAHRVILRYNNSRYYADTILKIADLLKGRS